MNGSERYLVELEFKRVGDGGIEQLTGKIKQAERGFEVRNAADELIEAIGEP